MRSHVVHSFSTSQKIVRATRHALIQKGILLKIHKVSVRSNENALTAPEENSNYCKFFLSGALEYLEAQRVAAEHQTIFFYENDIRFETRAVWRIDLVSTNPRAFFVETKNFIPHCHPDVARFAVHAYGIQDALENRRAAFFLLAADFTAYSLSLRRSIYRRVLYVLASVAKAVVLAHSGL